MQQPLLSAGFWGSAAENSVMKTYEQAFITAFGQPDPNNEWGFGTSVKAATRGTRADLFNFSLPSNPTFKDKDNIVEPTISGVYNTVADATNARVTVVDATNKQNFNVESNKSYAINSNSSLSNLGNVSNTVIYITENMTFNMSLNQNANNTVVITNGITVTVNSINQNQTYYVAEGATLIFPYDISVERGFHLFMGSGSTVNTQNMTIKGVNPTSSIKNNGGTLNIGTEQNKKTLTLENGVTLWNEGTVNVYQEFKMVNNNSAVYNAPGHTITIPGLTINNNNNLIVNDGTFTINGDIELRNVNAEVVNNGNLSGTSLTLVAGGKFHNIGTTTIAGKTTVDNNNSIGGEWKNEGTFITEDFEIKAFAQKVWNCCKMIVHKANDTGIFKIYGEFVLDRGASITTDNVDWVNKSNVYMNGLSLFKVKETFDSDNKDRNCGIHAMADEWAVLKAKSIVQRNNTNDQFRMAYYGNLWVDTQSHFPIWYKDDKTDQPNYKFFGNAKFGHEGDAGCPFIPVDNIKNCTPGYGRDPEPEPSSDIIRVICEDLSVRESTDWDFNDAVFDVQLLGENSKVKITLLAAGGTLPLTVAGEEVHGKFKEFNPDLGISTGTMLSTGNSNSTNKYDYINCTAPYYIIDNMYGSTVLEVAKNIPVQVQKLVNGKKTWVTLECKKGKATAKVAVNDTFEWCDERYHINSKYLYHDALGNDYGGFTFFVRGVFDANEWYNYKGPITDEMRQEYTGQ